MKEKSGYSLSSSENRGLRARIEPAGFWNVKSFENSSVDANLLGLFILVNVEGGIVKSDKFEIKYNLNFQPQGYVTCT